MGLCSSALANVANYLVEKRPFGTLTVPGYRYLGPGNHYPNGAPVNFLDSVAMEHDRMYGVAEQLEGRARVQKFIEADALFVHRLATHHRYATLGETVLARLARVAIGWVKRSRERRLASMTDAQ